MPFHQAKQRPTPYHRNVIRLVRLLVLLTAAAGGFVVPLHAAVHPPKLEYQIATLPNGLRVILSEDHSTPIVHLSVWYHVCSRN